MKKVMGWKTVVSILLLLTMLPYKLVWALPYVEDMNEYVVDYPSAYEVSENRNIDLNISGRNFYISFDAAAPSSVYMTTDTGTFQLFQHLGSRGPILRENNTPVWLFSENGNRVEWGQTIRNYRLEINMTTKNITTWVDGAKTIYSSTESTFTEKTAYSFNGGEVKSINFSDGVFSKVKVYYPPPTVSDKQPEDHYYSMWMECLNRLGIITGAFVSTDISDTLTKAQFATLAARLLGAQPHWYTGESYYTDVRPANSAFSYINILHQRGYLRDNQEQEGRFRPNDMITLEQAIEIMGKILGYDTLPAQSGSYGNISAYITSYPGRKILDNVNMVSGAQLLTMRDAVAILYNCLALPINTRTVYGEEAKYSTADLERCILRLYHGYLEYEAEIKDVKKESRKVTVNMEELGDKIYALPRDISAMNILGTKQKIWVSDDTIVYMHPYKFSRTVYGYIGAYNRDLKQGQVMPKELRRISLMNFEGWLTASADFSVIKDGQMVETSFAPYGCFVRLDIESEQIKRLNILGETIEGGVATFLSETQITYLKGEEKCVLDMTVQSPNTITVLNGKEVSYDKIERNMYFDYISNNDMSYLIFSDMTVTGTFKSYEETTLEIGDVWVNRSARPVYVSMDGGTSYIGGYNLGNVLAGEIKAICDMTGAVRYILSDNVRQYYGVVCGSEEQWDGSLKLSVALAVDGKCQKSVLTYKPKDGIMYYPEVSYATAVANEKNIEGKGVYKFTVANDNILRIEQLEWRYDSMITTGKEINRTSSRIVNNSEENKYTYVDSDALVFVLLDSDGEFSPDVVDFYSLTNKKITGFNNFSFNVSNKEPAADVVVFGAGADNLYDSTWYFGVITEIRDGYGEDGETKKYVIEHMQGTHEFVLPKGKEILYEGKPASKFDVVLYAFNGVFKQFLGPINTRTLSILDPNLVKYSHNQTTETDQETVTNTRDFFIAGTFLEERSGFVKVNKDQTETWIKKNSTCRYLLYKGGKIQEVTENHLIGKKIYVGMYEGMLQIVIGINET